MGLKILNQNITVARPLIETKEILSLAQRLAQSLVAWYAENKRPLPWRVSRDPYRIWISEVMLQQTTVTAVIPYYEKFMTRFASVEKLAEAPESEVLKYWSGLGYYSRARNIHKTAKAISNNTFPQTVDELLELPGLGPYTARAIASIAFDVPVGVLDGNVIRILSRVTGSPIQHWKSEGRKTLQHLADQLAQSQQASILNQAMMELGATVCTPQKPTCIQCPWMANCAARNENKISSLPLSKPRRKKEIWIWNPHLKTRAGQLALVQNDYAPFLKGSWLPPGRVLKVQSKPKKFDLKHTITHHEIYVQVSNSPLMGKGQKWFPIEKISSVNPSALLTKLLELPR